MSERNEPDHDCRGQRDHGRGDPERGEPQQLVLMQRLVDLSVERTRMSAQRSEMSAERSYMNAERTLSVWLRTALAAMVVGIAVDRFGLLVLRQVRSGATAGPHALQLGLLSGRRKLSTDVHQSTIQAVVSMSVSEARAALPQLLSRVENGEEVTVTRHGRPVAVLVRPDALRSRRARAAMDEAERIEELLTEAAAGRLPEDAGLTAARAEELIAAIRTDRDAR